MKKAILTLGILVAGVTGSYAQHVDSPTNYGFRLWGSDHYKMHLGYGTDFYYGPVQNWAIKMNNYPHATAKRGWVWGVSTPGVAPVAALNIFGDMQIKKDFVAEGSLAVGTTIDPSHKLHVGGSGRFTMAGDRNLDILGWSLAGPSGVTIATSNTENGGHLPLAFAASNFYFHAGSVGIGTTKVSGVKLSVAGKVRATEVEVSLSSGWADFVFEDDYELNSLSEVEAYITENNHLPNVPSEKEVTDKGVNLGEMDAILLRKIEELTLYVIAQQKDIVNLKNQLK
jgi:hypothetical protein